MQKVCAAAVIKCLSTAVSSDDLLIDQVRLRSTEQTILRNDNRGRCTALALGIVVTHGSDHLCDITADHINALGVMTDG
jgi:hypothetical protein